MFEVVVIFYSLVKNTQPCWIDIKLKMKLFLYLYHKKMGRYFKIMNIFCILLLALKSTGIHIDNEKVPYNDIEALVEVLTMIKAEVQKILAVGES